MEFRYLSFCLQLRVKISYFCAWEIFCYFKSISNKRMTGNINFRHIFYVYDHLSSEFGENVYSPLFKDFFNFWLYLSFQYFSLGLTWNEFWNTLKHLSILISCLFFYLGGEIKDIFIASGLPQPVLAHIWWVVKFLTFINYFN